MWHILKQPKGDNMPTTGSIVQINVNPKGGVPKHVIPSTTLGVEGVAGDKQRDRRHHGGPSRAVSLYAIERIEALRAEGHPITPGSTGENLTIAGLDWSALTIGTRLTIGLEVELEITGYAAPCSTIAESFSAGEFTRIGHKINPGWSRLYARVLNEGIVQQGDQVSIQTFGQG
jgi:MOSC domain-containing protein YiiM